MIQPKPVTFYVYGETDQEVQQLSQALYDFVDTNFRKGVVVTASKLTGLIRQYGMSPLMTQVLKSNRT